MKINKSINLIMIVVYCLFIGASFIFDFAPGKSIGFNFVLFLKELLSVMPFVFILIGLFEVWVKRETVEKHLGEDSGFLGFVWAVLFAGTVIGGLYIAFPVAYSLYNKGARLRIVFTYIGAAAIARAPMTIFEASFLGVKFTAVRMAISLPLVILTASLLEKYLEGSDYKVQQPG